MAFSFQLSVNLLRFATPKSKVDNIIHYKWAMDRHSPWSSCDEWGVWSFGPRCWQHRLCKDIKVWQLSIYPLSDFLHISYDIVMNTKRCIHDTLLYKNIILIDIIVLPKKKTCECWFIHCIIFDPGRKHSRSRPRKNTVVRRLIWNPRIKVIFRFHVDFPQCTPY